MHEWLLNVRSKNAFREIPEGKLNAILAGMKSTYKQDRIQAVVMAIAEGYKIGVKDGEENEQIKRNIKRYKRTKN